MKKMKKRMLALSGLLIAALPLLAETGTVGDYTYNYIDNGDGTVTLSCDYWDENENWVVDCIQPSPTGMFAVPETIDGKRVVSIDGDVLRGNGVTSVSLPASVTNLPSVAFSQANALTNITVDADNPAYKSVAGMLYTKDGKTLVTCPHGRGGSIVIPPGTECIGQNAFAGHYTSNIGLLSVVLPDGLKVIEDNAFVYCLDVNFTSVTIPASVEAIGAYAFGHCSNLATVTFAGAEGDIDIAATAFAGTPYDAAKPFSLAVDEWGNLVGIHGVAPTNLVLADHLNGQTLTWIGYEALSAWSYSTASVTNVVVPEGVTGMSGYTFSGCSALASVTLPMSLQSVGYGAFNDCTSLRTITIPSGVVSVSDAFYGCTNLTVYAPSTLRDMFSVPDGCTIKYYEVPVYTVTFDANGGTVEGETAIEWTDIRKGRRLDYVSAIGLPTPILSGYAFLGWFTAAEGGDEVTAEKVVTGDMTLYAHWEEIVYTYNYIDNGDGTVTLSGYDAYGSWVGGVSPAPVGEFTVPGMIDGKRVVAIGDSYFDSCSDLTGVIIPDSVTSIGNEAFRDCGNLSSVVIGSGVTNIGRYAFAWCYSLANVAIPDSVASIDEFAFYCCDGLTSFSVGTENANYKSVNGLLLSKDGKTLVAGVSGNATIPDTVTSIGGRAFAGRSGFSEILIPNSVTNIGDDAFGWCYSLTTVTIPDSVLSVREGAFRSCSSLASVTVGRGVTNIGQYAFGYCSSLDAVTFAGDELEIDIADTAFIATPYDAAKPFALIVENGTLGGIHGVAPENLVLADYLNGQTLTGIGGSALSAWSYSTASVTNVVVPESVTWIDNYAFSGCTALESVTLPETLQYIYYGVFSGCTSLRAIRIPAGVTYVDNAFYGCTNLTVVAPSTLRDTFSVPEGCTIEYYEIPEYTVTLNANGGMIDGEATVEVAVLQGQALGYLPTPSQEGYDFVGWFMENGTWVPGNLVVTNDMTLVARWLTASPWHRETFYWDDEGEQIGVIIMGADESVVTNGVLAIPATLTALNDDGEEVEMPVAVIADDAFWDWPRIETLVLPASVKMVGNYAFGSCRSLTSVTFLGERNAIDMNIGYAFENTPWLDAQPFTWMTSEDEDNVYLEGFYGSPVPDDTLVIPAGVTTMRSNALPYRRFDTVRDGDGYRRFLGWYTAAEGGERVDSANDNWEIVDVEIAGGTTLYARWEAAEPEWSFDVEDGQAIICGNAVSLVGDVEMPATVTVEEEDGEGNVTDVSYPVVAIGEGALTGMEITSVTIPASVTNIGDWAFEDCGNLTNVVFAGGMENIEMRVSSAFCGTPWLEAYLASLPSPANDDLAAAAQIAGASGRTTGTNMGAGIEDGEPLGLRFDSTATVWWRWTAPTNGSLMFTTQGSSFDTVMGVYTGTAVDSLVMVAEDDDDGPKSTSAVAFDAVAGTVYYIAVAGYAENVGDIVLSWDVDAGVIVEARDNIVTENGDGSYTITAPAGGELTEDDVDGIEVKVRFDGGWIYTTEGYDVVFGGGVITVSLKKPEVNTDIYPAAKDPDDKSGFLVDPEVVTVAAEPDVGEGETLGALPVKAVPGLWYRASWGDSLHGMTTGEAVQADDPALYLGVIRQDGASGFYKVSVSDQ